MRKEIEKQIEDIIHYKFKSTQYSGYDPKDVDLKFDELTQIYETIAIEWNDFCEKYDVLKAKYDDLEKDNQRLHQELLKSQSFIKQMESSGVSFAILNERLNKLENNKNNNTASVETNNETISKNNK